MTISKKLLFIGVITSAAGMAQAAYQEFDLAYIKAHTDSVDKKLLIPFINRAEVAFKSAEAFCDDIKTEKKSLYKIKKHALKTIKKELKHAAKNAIKIDRSLGNEAQLLYKAFKHDVYKYWKKNQALPVIQQELFLMES